MVFVLLGTHRVQAQAPTKQQMDTIRRLATLTLPDQRQVRQWCEAKIQEISDKIAGGASWTDVFNEYRTGVLQEYANTQNTSAFKAQLVTQFGDVASEWFGRSSTAPAVARTLARLMADFAGNLQTEAFAGLIAGLKSSDAAARYLSATGLLKLQRDIVTDKERLDRMVAALREAGVSETDHVVLWEIYRVLAVPAAQTSAVADAYLAIFEARLTRRQANNVNVDGAETDAFEYFRRTDVQGALGADQRTNVARAVATFLARDAQRYNSPELDFTEIETLERRMVTAEDVLRGFAGGGEGGNIADALSQYGYAGRQQVLTQVYRWIGDPNTNTPGALNKAPWNVPVGGI